VHLTGLAGGIEVSQLVQALFHPPRDTILDSDGLVGLVRELVGRCVHFLDHVRSAVRGGSELVQHLVVERQQVMSVHARVVCHACRPRVKGPINRAVSAVIGRASCIDWTRTFGANQRVGVSRPW
jgi:hypothetical protein